MIDIILKLGHAVPEWFSAHPAAGAVVFGWCFGISVTQAAKRYFPLYWSTRSVKRLSQALSAVAAGAFAWRVWPVAEPLGCEYALLAGMSCPMVYTIIKAALPNVLRAWGWAQISRKRASKP